MPRFPALIFLFAAALCAQQQQPAQEPPEEDESLTKTEYAFNPLQAEKEIQVGGFYMKKGSFKAAAGRFREATRWNPGNAEGWYRLGEAEEKLKRKDEAKTAWARFLELAPEDKRADSVRKKLGRKR